MSETKAKAWTETEKLGLLFQIIEHVDKIPWTELTFPEGRTKKACVVMLDREKQKLKKALAEDNKGQDKPASKKRGFQDDGDDEIAKSGAGKPSKKGKGGASRAKKPKVKAEPEIELNDDEEDSNEEIKDEEIDSESTP